MVATTPNLNRVRRQAAPNAYTRLLAQQQLTFRLGVTFYIIMAVAIVATLAMAALRALRPEIEFTPLATTLTTIFGIGTGGGGYAVARSLMNRADQQMQKLYEIEQGTHKRRSP